MNFERFMKQSKAVQKNVRYAATASLTDENGKPLEWEFKRLSSKEVDDIRNEATEMNRDGSLKTNTNLVMRKMVTAATVYPDLNNAELQNSYEVMGAEDLLMEMVDNPGEYDNLVRFITKLHGYDVPFEEKVSEAKN